LFGRAEPEGEGPVEELEVGLGLVVVTGGGLPVTPWLAFCGKPDRMTMIPRTTAATRIAALSVEVATERNLPLVCGSCIPCSPEPYAPPRLAKAPQPLHQHGVVFQCLGSIDQPVQELIIPRRGKPEAIAYHRNLARGELGGDPLEVEDLPPPLVDPAAHG